MAKKTLLPSAGLAEVAADRSGGGGVGGGSELTMSERTLLFDSRFEGGNLAKVVQVHELVCYFSHF